MILQFLLLPISVTAVKCNARKPPSSDASPGPKAINWPQDSKNMTVNLSPNETVPRQEPQGDVGDGGGGRN